MSERKPWSISNIFGPTTYILPIDIILLICAIGSTLLSLLLLYITCFKRKGKVAIDTIMIFLIGIFDLMSSCFIVFSQIYKWATDNEYTKAGTSWCIASSILFAANTIVTLGLVAIFSLLRYLIIVRGIKIHNIVSIVASLVLIFSTYGFLFFNPIERFTLNPSGIYCLPQMWGRYTEDRATGIFILLVVLLSLIMIPLFNFLVAVHYSKIVHEMGSLSRIPGYSKLKSNTVKLFLVVIAYIIAIFPEFISVIVVATARSNGSGIKRTAVMDGIVITLLFCVTIINSCFTLFLHDDTKRELYSLFRIDNGQFDTFKMKHTSNAESI